MTIAVVDYGGGNVRSLCAALIRAGGRPDVTTDARAIRDAALAVVAGVGHMAAAARALAAGGLDDALRERVREARPVFGICVGMQLLFGESEEGGTGLELLGGNVRRLRALRVPHMGWNTLDARAGSSLESLDGRDVYFAHSYACAPEDDVTVATTSHYGEIVAAVERGPLLGVQFHPERSGGAGKEFLSQVLAWSRDA